MERFAKCHRKALNHLFGIHIAKSPSDSTFRWLRSQLDVEGFESLLQQWITAQPGVSEVVDVTIPALRCQGRRDGKPVEETRYDVTTLRTIGKVLLPHVRALEHQELLALAP
jgi:hypothetical protein